MCCFLAGYNVVRMADRKAFYFNSSLPGILEPFNAIWRKNQIEIEWPILELHEVFATFDLGRLLAEACLASPS